MRADARFKAAALPEPYEWYQQRRAEDIPREPPERHHRKWGSDAFLNWSDLRAFADALKQAFPDLVYFPAVFTGSDYEREPPPEAVVPIYRDFFDCVLDPNQGHVIVVRARWPWPDEIDSTNPDVLAGRIHGAQSPWLDPPWRLPTKWSRHRRIGRGVSIAIRFRGYLRVQEIRRWEGRPYWGEKLMPDGRRLSNTIPDSWIFAGSANSSLHASHSLEDIDSVYFCETIMRLWRNVSTECYAIRDDETGEIKDGDRKSHEFRYGWNSLKHAISGSRHFVSFGPYRHEKGLCALGPAKKHVKKALANPDLVPFDAYDTPYRNRDYDKPL
jgi:hypothetical protein